MIVPQRLPFLIEPHQQSLGPPITNQLSNFLLGPNDEMLGDECQEALRRLALLPGHGGVFDSVAFALDFNEAPLTIPLAEKIRCVRRKSEG